MTQSVVNSMNNIQELMTQAQQKASSVASEVSSFAKNNSVVDRNTDLKSDNKFDKIFEKQIEKETQDTESKKDVSEINEIPKTVPPTTAKTMDDVKNNATVLIDVEKLANFREVLAEITAEANVETSLDLTLGKDIDEVISKLKGSLEAAIEVEETTVDESAVVEEIVSSSKEQAFSLEDVAEEPVFNQAVDKQSDSVYGQISIVSKPIQEVENINKESDVLNINSQKGSENLLCELSQDEIEMTIIDDIQEVVKPVVKETEQDAASLEDLVDEDILKELNIEEIKSEMSFSQGEGSLMEQQTPQEQGIKAMLVQDVESFDIKIDKAFSTQSAQSVQTKAVDITPSKIIEQVVKQMEGLQNTSKVNIVLNPESLGRVTIQLIKTGEGLSAQFTVANQEVRDMLMKGLDGLKETLTAHGVGVDNVSIKLNDTQKSEYNSDWTELEGSRGGNKEQGRSQKDEKEKGLFEQMMAQFNEENGKV